MVIKIFFDFEPISTIKLPYKSSYLYKTGCDATVAYLFWVQEVAGSNPVTPNIKWPFINKMVDLVDNKITINEPAATMSLKKVIGRGLIF